MREQLLFSVEYSEQQVLAIKTTHDLGTMPQDEFNKILHHKQTVNVLNNGSRYRIVTNADLENTLMQGGFRYTQPLDNGVRHLLEVADY